MNERQAMYKAADSIEQNPEMFNFGSIEIPDCNTSGCALGWILFHAEESIDRFSGRGLHAVAENYLGLSSVSNGCEFYNRMATFNPWWSIDAQACADAMRKYADKYHPEQQVDFIPASVRRIFQEPALI